MTSSDNPVLSMPEFKPLLRVITTPIQADLIAYFQNHPGDTLDAPQLAGKINQEGIESVQKALGALEAAGVLTSEIKGVAQTRHYSFSPDPGLKQLLDNIFSDREKQDTWQEFRIYLADLNSRRQSRKKLIILTIGILAALALAAGVYFLVQFISFSGEDKPPEDLSRFTGVHETWYSRGQIKSRIEYSNGLREGSFSAWFENGQKMAEGAYRGNLPQGNWVYRNKKGEPLTIIVFEDGQAVD